MEFFNKFDVEVAQEIAARKLKLDELIGLAREKEAGKDYDGAIMSYHEAMQQVCRVGDGLKARTTIEKSDLENWDVLNSKILELEECKEELFQK